MLACTQLGSSGQKLSAADESQQGCRGNLETNACRPLLRRGFKMGPFQVRGEIKGGMLQIFVGCQLAGC